MYPSTLREGRYAVIGLLGEGAQAQTLEAVDKKLGRPVAIKRFVVRGARSWKDVELAEREARVLSTLSHPALPGYVEHFEENGELYLVMEKVEGESLAALRARGVLLSRGEVLRFLGEIGDLLAYLHGLAPPVFHRDIKPGNVIRRPDGSFTLVDFGSVRDRLKVEGGSTVVGTFGYMAPEQFQGRALPQTDVYAAGATAICLLSGQDPETLPHEGLRIDVERVIPSDPELAALLTKLLEPDPDRRPADLRAVLSGVRRQGGAPTPAPDSPHTAAATMREPLPLFVFVLFVLGLSVARISVALAVGVLVPTLLLLLSVLFGGGLRRAADSVRGASQRADEALVRALHLVRRMDVADGKRRRVRVEEKPRRKRVVDTTGEPLDEREREGQTEAEAQSGGRRRSRR